MSYKNKHSKPICKLECGYELEYHDHNELICLECGQVYEHETTEEWPNIMDYGEFL